jgi:peptidoglycan hydrolase-like protein with peptidoglycan-binding domain
MSTTIGPSTTMATATTTSTPTTTPPRLQPSPTMKQAIEEGALIKAGQRGGSVQHLQDMLSARGYPCGSDGKFGPETRRMVEAFQRDHGCVVDGIVGPETLSAFGLGDGEKVRRSGGLKATGGDGTLRAPRADEQTTPGGLRAGDLQRSDEARRAKAAASSSVTTPIAPGTPADQRLQQIQSASMDKARADLDAGVKEDPRMGNNRSKRIDEYAKSGGMDVGQEWCGHFTAFQYTSAAKDAGLKFSGQMRMHSYEKARSFFLYRNYTDASKATVAKDEARRAKDTDDGSARRYMTFQGSTGDRFANGQKLPHEVYTSPRDLPIRAGDTALFSHGHVGMVEAYNPATGILTTIEGNNGNKVARKTYDLNDPAVRAKFDGFGRPAAGDFT